MNQTLETIHNLHTTHGDFTSQPIDDEVLNTILQACVMGANASNRQDYSIVVIRGEEKVERILSCGAKSPVALLFCADFNRIYDIGEHIGYPSDYDSLFNYLTSHTDAVIAAQTAVISAASLGLAYLFTNSIHHAQRKNLTELYKELNLPNKHCFPVTAVLLGYEDKKPVYKTGRLKGTGILHYDTYKPLTIDQKEEIIKIVNDPENHFGYKGDYNSHLDFYYAKWAPPMPTDMKKKADEMLYAKLTSFINR